MRAAGVLELPREARNDVPRPDASRQPCKARVVTERSEGNPRRGLTALAGRHGRLVVEGKVKSIGRRPIPYFFLYLKI